MIVRHVLVALFAVALAGTVHAASEGEGNGGIQQIQSPARTAAVDDELNQALESLLSGEQGGGHGDGKVHWNYEGSTGPDSWGRLSRDFEACDEGMMQSPIDIRMNESLSARGAPIMFDYNPTALRILHNGHTVQVNYAPGSGITVDGKRYELKQFHFHSPSEHAVNGTRSVMEVHFVHASSSGELAVVSVLADIGSENMPLAPVWSNMPAHEMPEQTYASVTVDGMAMLPNDRTYYRYMGSLTTPPCSEGVNWYVLDGHIQVSAAQQARFVDAVGQNARPLQPRNNRLVMAPRLPN